MQILELITKRTRKGNSCEFAMHCNLKPPDVASVVLDFNCKALNGSVHKFNISAIYATT